MREKVNADDGIKIVESAPGFGHGDQLCCGICSQPGTFHIFNEKTGQTQTVVSPLRRTSRKGVKPKTHAHEFCIALKARVAMELAGKPPAAKIVPSSP